MSVLGLRPNAQIVDPATGQLTRDGFQLFQSLVESFNGAGSGVTVDAVQTLTNKTIDGNLNTLSNIDTDSLKTRTGDDENVVTGTAGIAGYLAIWNANGDLVAGPLDSVYVPSVETVVLLDGTQAMGAPLPLLSATVATVPAAADWTGGLIYVSDEVGGATPAFSDGTNWRRFSDRAIIS